MELKRKMQMHNFWLTNIRPTRQQRVDSVSVAGGLFVKEGLSMEVDAVEVFGRAHVDQVPGHKLLGVHPQALQTVYDAIDGLEYRQKILVDFRL